MEDNDILRRLRDFPTGDIYILSPREFFLRGYEYYRDRRLLRFVWSRDNRILTAFVLGSHAYPVKLTVKDNRLRYECDCPAWTPHSHCKHVICAMLTIKNIFNPALFEAGRGREQYRRLLTDALLPGSSLITTGYSEVSADPPAYALIIEGRHNGSALKLTVEENGLPISDHYGYKTPSHKVPVDLRAIVRDSIYFGDHSDMLIDHLKKHGDMYPLFLKIGGKKQEVRWDESLRFSSRTAFDVTAGMVTVRKLYIAGDTICASPYPLGKRFAVDLDTQNLGIVVDEREWNVWRNLAGDELFVGFADDHTTEDTVAGRMDIPLKIFENYQLILPVPEDDALKSLILKVDNGDAPLVRDRHRYSIVIEKNIMDPDRFVLMACCNTDSVYGTTTESIFGFLSFIGSGNYLSPQLRAQKRRAVLVTAFLRLLNAVSNSAADKIIREVVSSNPDFRKHTVKREAKRLLSEAFSIMSTRSSRLGFGGGRWHLIRNDKDKEALLYTIPFELFGADIFRDMMAHNDMTVSGRDLYRNLSELFHRLNGHGIQLLFKGKPVRSSAWEFSLDARNKKGIDWFEIKPEITCNGELVDSVSWQDIIKQNGVVEKDGFIEIMDSNSQEILKTIESMYDDKAPAIRPKEVVQISRLRILDWIYLRSKGVDVRLSKEDEAVIERLNSFERIEERPLPENLNAKLRHYQKEGYYWLSFLYEHRFGACLADDMGLGKTLQAITLLAGLKEGIVNPYKDHINAPHLIVLPPSLLFNWENELQRFYPGFNLHFYTGKERTTDFKGYDIVLTTYGLVRRDIDKLKDVQFHVIIFDEAQSVKNIYADTTGAVRQLRGHFKLTITGTPLENHIGEYYSILDLALPGLLGEYDDFKAHIKSDVSPLIDTILRRTRPFVLRRTKARILKELPQRTESDIYLELTERQKALYKKTVDMVKATIDSAYRDKTVAQAQIIALTAILKLRQICVSPRLIDRSIDELSPKTEFLLTKLKELMSEGHKALVFSQFTSFLDIVEEDLVKNNISFCRLDGSTAVGKRKGLVEGFQKDDTAAVFLLSLKAGGQGLNLTRASYVFHLDPWWNPAVENQASDRAHRIGQNKKVTITRILMHHTVEEKMMTLKKKKLELYKAVMGETTQVKKGLSISRADFEYLLG